MPSEDGPLKSATPEAKTVPGIPAVSPLATPTPELAGVRVGPYEIKGLLGQGGFGQVYLAEQHDPVQRTVALKMLNPDRRGQHFRELFDAERRVLAQIDHPNVARIWDAGTTPDGREWVAMEYVPGRAIDLYCDENKLTIAERVRLLASVARAMDFAHEKGVVHRDLKPGNILVSVDGGRAVAKIIDFGIARVLGTELSGAEPERAMGTPGFMAPEQTVGGGADADARADVYSLGAILYSLCTGAVPLQDETTTHTPASLAALTEKSRHADAPLMSQRMLSMTPADAERVAIDRRTTPRELVHALRGDLDWIAARCLDRDRMRRYADAGALAEDLRRWARQRPVDAAPDTIAYRTRKFVQRNQIAVVLVVILGVTGIAGLVTSVLGWRTAILERDLAGKLKTRATDQASEARAAATFITSVLGSASLNRAPSGASLTVVDLLHQAAQHADRELKDRPATDAAVRLALGRTYSSLGLLDEARDQLLRARFLTERVYGRETAEVAECIEALAEVDLLRHHPVTARTLAQEARRTLSVAPGDNTVRVARNSMLLAQVDLEAGKPEDALRQLATATTELGENPDRSVLSSIQWYSALADLDLGRFQQALLDIDKNLAYNRTQLPDDHWWIAESETVQAAALAGLGSTEEAWTILQRAMPRLESALTPTAPVMRKAFARAAFVAEKSGHTEAAAKYKAQAHRPPRQLPDQPPGTPGAHTNDPPTP